jgi:hypothetical protein
MRLVSPEVTATWAKLLNSRDTAHGEDITDSSDDDDGFQRQRSDRRRAKLAAKRDDKAFSANKLR